MAHRVHLDANEVVNKANAVVDAEERGERWEVTGLSPMSEIRLNARVEHERRTRQAIRRLQGRNKKSRGKSKKSGIKSKSKKSGKSSKSK
jgi:hypothetical protein